MSTGRVNILKNRNLLLLGTGHVISPAGNATCQIALPWLVLGVTALSTALLGPIAEWVPIATIFILIGLGAALCGIAGLSH